MEVICVGSSAKDIFFPTNEGVLMNTPKDVKSQKKIVFEAGAKYHIDDRYESLGGCAANVSVGLKILGIAAGCYTNIGDDSAGKWIREEIVKEKVDDGLMTVEKNCQSGLSAIIVDRESGERVIFSNQEANEKLKVVPEKIKDAAWISVTDPSGDWKGALEAVIGVSRKTGAKIVFNPRGKNIQEDPEKVYELSGNTEIFFVNKDEAIEIVSSRKQAKSDLNNEENLLRELKKAGAKVVVVTDGEKGAWAYDGAKMIQAEALREKAIDTTGAGDAFSSGFLAAYIQGKNLEECVRWGIANGGNVVNYYGGIRGLLSSEEIIKRASSVKAGEIIH